MGSSENRILQVGPTEVRLFQVGPAEDGPLEMCAAEVCPSQVGSPQIKTQVLSSFVNPLASSEDGEGGLNVSGELSWGRLLIRRAALLPGSALADIGGQDFHHRPVVCFRALSNSFQGIDAAEPQPHILPRAVSRRMGKAFRKVSLRGDPH